MPPPQPVHKEIANNKAIVLANFTREDLFAPTISDPLSLKIRAPSNICLARRIQGAACFRVADAE
jgi:hypothetical protein